WSVCLRGEVKEEASAAGGGRGTFARKAYRSRPPKITRMSADTKAGYNATARRRPRGGRPISWRSVDRLGHRLVALGLGDDGIHRTGGDRVVAGTCLGEHLLGHCQAFRSLH